MGFLGHSWEIILIFVVALLVFGPKKLPEMGSAIGKTVTEFKRGMSEITSPKDNDTPATSLNAVEHKNTVDGPLVRDVDSSAVEETTRLHRDQV